MSGLLALIIGWLVQWLIRNSHWEHGGSIIWRMVHWEPREFDNMAVWSVVSSSAILVAWAGKLVVPHLLHPRLDQQNIILRRHIALDVALSSCKTLLYYFTINKALQNPRNWSYIPGFKTKLNGLGGRVGLEYIALPTKFSWENNVQACIAR